MCTKVMHFLAAIKTSKNLLPQKDESRNICDDDHAKKVRIHANDV